jgi:redox-sensitive bicupin YhaK (pirin superfamily)
LHRHSTAQETIVITTRPANERLHTSIGWLDSRHTFSFGEHIDPRHMGFHALRVINEDRVAPGQGFGTHPHRDMEIISYMLEGALRHEDSLGTGSVINVGDVQSMSAGTGVLHSERNASNTERAHFLQIWVLPERTRLTPSYQQRTFPVSDRRGRLTLIASRDSRAGSIRINQDVDLYSAVLKRGELAQHSMAEGRHAWVQVARGAVDVNGTSLTAGDGAALTDELTIRVAARDEGEILLFDLA